MWHHMVRVNSNWTVNRGTSGIARIGIQNVSHAAALWAYTGRSQVPAALQVLKQYALSVGNGATATG